MFSIVIYSVRVPSFRFSSTQDDKQVFRGPERGSILFSSTYRYDDITNSQFAQNNEN